MKVPPGSEPRAIILKYPYAYDDTESFVPEMMRKHIPESMKVGGKLQLYKNEEGFIYQKHPNGKWARAMFIRNGHQLHVVLPLNFVVIGAMFRSLDSKLRDKYPATIAPVSSVSLQSGETKLERFVKTFWNAIRQDVPTLKKYYITPARYGELFSNANYQANIDRLTSGMNPGVRSILQDGRYNLQDLLNLPKVTAARSARGQSIYLRVYADLSSTGKVGLYIGQTYRSLLQRQSEHERHIAVGSNMLHYRLARRSRPENRRTIELFFWDEANKQSSSFIDMVEQTMIILFDCYHPWISRSDGSYGFRPKDLHTRNHCLYLRSISRQARIATDWQHSMDVVSEGCNVASPLFAFNSFPSIHSYKMRSSDPATRTFTTYRRTCTFLRKWKPYFALLSYYKEDGGRVQLYFPLKAECFQQFTPKTGYIVFEIMDDHKPHPSPWLGCPSVGPFQNFDLPSSLGIRFEWFDETRNEWLTAPVVMPQMYGHAIDGVLLKWRKVLSLIQALEGITWSGTLNGLEKNLYWGPGGVTELAINHLEQTCQWVSRQGRVCSTPELADWNHNFRLMVEQFARGPTIIRLEPPPQDDQFWRPTEFDARSKNTGMIRCDYCTYMTTNRCIFECERDPRRSDIWVCKHCYGMNRPCSFTPVSISQNELWGNDLPLLREGGRDRKTGWSQSPTGPHRQLAFHKGVSHEKQTTPTRIREPFDGKACFMEQEEENVVDVAVPTEDEDD
ncbi:hypothetical protein ACHAPJ_010874 [Fusarium lateritium]